MNAANGRPSAEAAVGVNVAADSTSVLLNGWTSNGQRTCLEAGLT